MSGEDVTPSGPSSRDPYALGLAGQWSFPVKTEVRTHMVALGRNRHENNCLTLIMPQTRAVLKGEMHELMVTDEEEAGPGLDVKRTATLGFFVVDESGLIARGDEVWIGDHLAGEMVGFDLGHFPNHLNVVFRASTRKTGVEWGLRLGEVIRFRVPRSIESQYLPGRE